MEKYELKIKKIQEINDEVKKFHPLLKDLLPKLPEVSNVTYTHGQNEMGADFIVTVRNPTLNLEEYVGLIVKCGDIKQNFDTIERQIEECSVGRKIHGGKNSVYLNQIWIITTGQITNNAKEKIHEKYRSKNINFIWDQKLVDLIESHYPEYWIDIDKNVALYLSATSHQMTELNSKFNLLNQGQENFYIEQNIIPTSVSARNKFLHNKKKLSEKLSSVLNKDRFVLVEAPMGYGKSRLLRETALEFSDHQKFINNNILPIFVNFHDLINIHNNSLKNLLHYLQNEKKIDIKNYSLLFFIDSVDEVKNENEIKIEKIAEFIKQANENENIRVVFATRPFNDPIIEQKIEQSLNRYQLKPLNTRQLIEFVERICRKISITSKFKHDLQKSDLFKSLPKTPISAILLGSILNTNLKELPSSLPELYSKFVDLALGKWSIKKGNTTEKEYETTVILVRLIAKNIFESGIPGIGLGDTKLIINEYLSARNTGQNADNIFNNIINCTEIISIDECNNLLFFRHRSFLEFMYSEILFARYGAGYSIKDPFAFYSKDVNFFYLGKLKDCPEQLDEVFNKIANYEKDRLIKLIYAGYYLLAAYQSPYENITDCVRKTVLEAADWYCKICEDPKESQLGRFSEIQLLAIISSLMCSTFQYNFFDRALIDIETDILLSVDSEKRKAVAAFLIASIRAGLGHKEAFTALIDEHYSNLPLVVKLGASHESKDANITNDALKKLEKKLRRSADGNPLLFKTIYEVSLNDRKDLINSQKSK